MDASNCTTVKSFSAENVIHPFNIKMEQEDFESDILESIRVNVYSENKILEQPDRCDLKAEELYVKREDLNVMNISKETINSCKEAPSKY